MREIPKGSFRSIYSGIWNDPEFRSLSDADRNLFIYLRTCDRCNIACLFTTFVHQIANDLNWSVKKVNRRMDSLTKTSWVKVDHGTKLSSTRTIWIVKGLINDPTFSIDNKFQVKNVLKTTKEQARLTTLASEFCLYYRDLFKGALDEVLQEALKGPYRGPHIGPVA